MASDQSSTEQPTKNKASELDPIRPGIVTVPNLLTGIRLLGSLGLMALAAKGETQAFAILFIVLVMTDWVDGKLARWLHQRTEWGARLDSMADATMFGALLLGCLLLKSDVLLAERYWVAMAVASYGLTTVAGLWKFGRIPAYHTRAAKTSWYFILVAVVFTFLDWSPWALRISMLAVTVTNLEATLITRTLPVWQADVLSLGHARRFRDRWVASGESEIRATPQAADHNQRRDSEQIGSHR